MSYSTTKSRVLQWLGIIAILCLFGGAYWYFKVYGSTLNAPQNDLNTNGLVGMWSFNGDDISGVTAYDRSGSGNNGTLTNGPVATQGKVGQALDFDGTNDYVATTDYSYSNAQAFTMSVWFKADTVSGNQVIFSKTTYEYNLRLTGSVLDFSYWDTGGLGEIDLSYSNVVANKWYLVNVVYTGSGAAYLYVDGVRVSSDTNIVDTFQNKAEALLIGGGYHISGNSGYLNGQIDEMRIYNRAITASEVTALYTQGGGTKSNTSISQPQGTGRLDSGLAAYWKFDDGSGTSATDSSTNSTVGTLANGPTWTTGQIGGAVNVDGIDDVVTVADANSLDIVGEVTFSAWIKPDTYTSSSNYRVILTKGSYGVPSVNYQFATYGAGASDQRLYFSYYGNSVANNIYGNTNLVPGSWYHVTVTYSDSTNSINMYVNGKLETETVSSGNPEGNSMTANAFDIEIGRYNSNDKYFDGAFDEFRLYSRVLSTDEVGQLYRLNSPTSVDTGLKGYWSFNAPDMASTTAYDRSGAGNTGTLTNGPAITEGKSGQALSFDGTDDYVDAGGASSLEPGFPFSISLWVKFDTLTGNNIPIVSSADIGDNGQYAGMWLGTASTGVVHVSLGNNNGCCDPAHRRTFATGSSVVTTGTWYHIVATVTDVNTAAIYVNGSSQSVTASGNAVSSVYPANSRFRIGAVYDANVTADSFLDGIADEVRIYNSALSAGEIQSLYTQGGGTKSNTSVSQPQGTGRLDSGLGGYWKLDDGSGTSATDSSTNGYTGTLTSGPTWTTGQIGGAVSFDGVDDYIDTDNGSSLDSMSEYTYAAWIYPTSADGFIIAKASNGGGSSGFRLISSTLQGWRANFTAWNAARSTSSSTVSLNTWSHVSMTYSHAGDKKHHIYLNGVEVVYSELDTNPVGLDPDVSYDFWIGRKQGSNEMVDVPFTGNIDDARIYNRALSSDEVAQLYRLNAPTGTETSLKGYWSFNGKDIGSSTAFDSSGAGSNGTLTNGPVVTEGKIGQGLLFDGTNDYVEMASTTTTYQYANTTFTVTGWFKKSGSSDGYIISQDVCNGGWGVRLNSGTLQFRLKSSGGCGGDAASRSSSTTSLNDGGWHHFAAVVTTDTVTSGNNDIVVYIDGAINQGSISRNGSPYATVATNLRVGYTDGAGGYFNGSLDEVRVYNRSLTAAEIAALYNASR